jgi:ADP-ribosylglycohydrolase
MDKITAKQVEAVLLGVAVGDALGVPVEFQMRGTFKVTDMTGCGTHNQPPGTWSDDTSLTLCLADSLSHGFSLDDIALNFVKWHDEAAFTAHGNVFDIGISTSKAIRNLKAGRGPDESGNTDVNENGNGSLMRIAPLVFYLVDKPQKERFEIVRQVSSITHSHDISVIACTVYIEYLLKLIEGSDKVEAFKTVQEEMTKAFADYDFDQDARLRFFRLLNPVDKIWDTPEEKIKSGGFVVDTIEATFWCFLNTDNYRDAVLKAVNLGGDTDTTAAVVGGMAGLFYGVDAIPQSWLKQLARYDDICILANNLF